jgi:uncharacterized protein with von Willebrand factor type A (vWA) domain
VVRFCRGQPELALALLGDVVAAVGAEHLAFSEAVHQELRELEALERSQKLSRKKQRKAQSAGTDAPEPAPFDESTLRRLRALAEQRCAERQALPNARLLQQWGEYARAWAEIDLVFGDLGHMLGRGWDLSVGVLAHTGWRDLLRLRALLSQLTELREIIRALGRLHATSEGPTVAESLFVPVRRLEEELATVHSPHVASETRGIERSGDISRMLPSEAVMLGHPKLRLLWHARRAERALVTYRVEGMEVERTIVERECIEEQHRERPRPERGPIIAVIDTSGSMHGLPERVAKAIVLEALRTAHAEKRRCLLFAYSGPGQVSEHELDTTAEGVGRLLVFLGTSFGGGNDEAGLMAQVVARLEREQWQKADVLFVSDGEWPAPTSLLQSVARTRELGTRIHGVQIGNRGRTGLHSVCDPVHVFTDWDKVFAR